MADDKKPGYDNSRSYDHYANMSEIQICSDEYDRLLFNIVNGHYNYVDTVNRNFRYFKGDGGQWSDADREFMEGVEGRKCIEVNGILPAVQTATGEQIFTRANINFDARKGKASDEVATVLSKLSLHYLTENGYHRKEKTVWKDGLIKQRGFFDVRMKFDTNLNGDVDINIRNPVTVIPDIYAESYDPKEWKEVTAFAWLSLDEIEGMYGKEARDKAENSHGWYSDNPMSDEFRQANAIDQRYGFGTGGIGQIYERSEAGEKRLRVIERQFWKWTTTLSYVNPKTGDHQSVPDHIKEQEAQVRAQAEGLIVAKMVSKKVWWRVSTRFALLHDTWSPYRSFTIIPYFYIFDYGQTISMVDNAIGPQDLENKSLTSFLHIINTTSNSGWEVPKGSLTNMTTKDLEQKGSKTGLVLEHDPAIGPPKKIQQTQPPKGFESLIERGKQAIKDVTGMQDADQMLRSHISEGSSLNAQFQQKMQLADPLDNLEFTRVLLGRKMLELFQDFLTSERIFKITEADEFGRPTDQEFVINKVSELGHIINDITLGEYEVTVNTKPTAVTWQQTQFNEAIRMRELQVQIPDAEIVRRSNLDNKHDLADQMSKPKQDPMQELELQLIAAKVKGMLAKATNDEAKAITAKIEGIFGAVNSARILAMVPGAAPLADELLLSSGFKDAQIPEPINGSAAAGGMPPENSHPNYPPSATSGMDKGIEGGGIPGRASGGPIRQDQPYIVGEQGPELVIPHGDGYVIPASTTEQLVLAKQGGHFAGLREDGTAKGLGWKGNLQRPDGGYSSELSASSGEPGNEVFYPLIHPGITQGELDHLLAGKQPTTEMYRKAETFARGRIKEGKSPFMD